MGSDFTVIAGIGLQNPTHSIAILCGVPAKGSKQWRDEVGDGFVFGRLCRRALIPFGDPDEFSDFVDEIGNRTARHAVVEEKLRYYVDGGFVVVRRGGERYPSAVGRLFKIEGSVMLRS